MSEMLEDSLTEDLLYVKVGYDIYGVRTFHCALRSKMFIASSFGDVERKIRWIRG